MFDQAKNSVKINRKSRAPLLVRHALNGDVLGWPYAVVCDQNIEPSKPFDGLGHKAARCIWAVEAAGDWVTGRVATFFGKGLGLRARFLIAEDDLGVGRSEKAHGGCADAARTARDQRYLTGEREGNW